MTQPTDRPAEHCGHQPDPVIGQPTECVLRPGHSGSHADHRGMRWWMAKLPDQPSTDRPGINHLTSDQLDQLYTRLDKAERAVDHLTDRYRGAEAEVQQWRDTYGEHALRRTLVRLHDAETTVERLRALAERWQHTGDRKDGPLRELRAVLDQHGQTPKETT